MAQSKKAIAVALGTAFAASVVGTSIANAADNPFAMQSLKSGYQVAAQHAGAAPADDKKKDGKCGEGKCGGDKKMKDGKCAGEAKKDTKAKEGKCAEGKCAEGKCAGDPTKKKAQ